MDDLIQVLAPRGRDAAVVVQVLTDAGLAAEHSPDLVTLLTRLDRCTCAVVTEEALYGPTVPRLHNWVTQQPAWSDLPFLVLATKQSGRRSDEGAALLARLGNALLLERPLNAETLVSAVRSALRARARQVTVRDLNATLEQRVAERTEALAASESQFRAIFDSFPDSLFVVDVTDDGRFLYDSYNPAAHEQISFHVADVRGRPPEAFMTPADAELTTAEFQRCLEAGASVSYTREMTAAASTPTDTPTFDVVVTPLRDASGRIVRLLGVARNVTERNRLEQRLRQAQKLEAVGQLTGGVAHDFNNLLQVVLSGLTLLERVQDTERRTQLLDSVRRAAQRGGELTKRLLTVARRQSLQPAAVDLGAWLNDGAGELLSRALRGDIRTDLRLPAGLPPVEVDPAELELAVLNLAVNARDAMPEGGTLTVSAEVVHIGIMDADGLRGSYVRLSVGDTGTGMDDATQARVFEPFFTTKGVGVGTGLGLAQVYGFARQSGGGVRLRSTPGRGTTVSLLLPVSRRPAPAAVKEAAPAASALLDQAAVLVCEDDDEVAALVVDMLRQLGHQPTRVSTAAAALGALADGRSVDLLFSDVVMPGGMDGLALAREAGRRRPGLPVLLTTGYTGNGAADMPLGVPVLRKPYRIEDLAQALERVLG